MSGSPLSKMHILNGARISRPDPRAAKWTLHRIGAAVALFLVVCVAGVHSHTEGAGLPSSLHKRSSISSNTQSLVTRASKVKPLPPLHGNQLYVDFTKLKSNSQLPALLSKNRLYVSEYPNVGHPLTYTFVNKNVDWANGAMRLKVSGQNGKGDVHAAEVATEAENILYGTVTTRAKLTSIKGVCQAFFFFGGDHAEIDIELLSTYYTKGVSSYGMKAGAHFANQPLKKGQKERNSVIKFPFDPSSGFHDYTVTWTKKATIFSFDGVVVAKLDTMVPQKPTAFIWNNWSSGDPYWSAGPPTQDAYLLISHVAGNWTTSKH